MKTRRMRTGKQNRTLSVAWLDERWNVSVPSVLSVPFPLPDPRGTLRTLQNGHLAAGILRDRHGPCLIAWGTAGRALAELRLIPYWALSLTH
jgi:hypothetical protein